MKNSRLFHIDLIPGNPAPENTDHLFVARSIYQQPGFQNYIYMEGTDKKATPDANRAQGNRNPLRNWVFRKILAPAEIKKNNADLFISFGIKPIRGKTQHQLIYSNSMPKQQPEHIHRFASNPELATQLKNGLFLPGFAHPEAVQRSWEEKEAARQQLCSGKEFFVTSLDEHNNKTIVELLKAFTLFKQRQRTNMIWVLAGSASILKQYDKLLSTYKWKEEILITEMPDRNTWLNWLGAAYSFIHLPEYSGWHLPLHDAMASGTPVITTSRLSYLTGNETALFTGINATQIAEQLKTVFKDENHRSQLIRNGMAKAATYSARHSAELMLKFSSPAYWRGDK